MTDLIRFNYASSGVFTINPCSSVNYIQISDSVTITVNWTDSDPQDFAFDSTELRDEGLLVLTSQFVKILNSSNDIYLNSLRVVSLTNTSTSIGISWVGGQGKTISFSSANDCTKALIALLAK